jgi:hypothetical protein
MALCSEINCFLQDRPAGAAPRNTTSSRLAKRQKPGYDGFKKEIAGIIMAAEASPEKTC